MIELEELRRIIKVGEIYKYVDLCYLLDEEPKRNDSKVAQLKRWKCLFEWENVTSQKFLITNIYDVPIEIEDGRKSNGGARNGAGAKKKLEYEFGYLLNGFLQQEWHRNDRNFRAKRNVAYFSNSKISRYFGLYADNFYDGKDDDVFEDVVGKINGKRRTWILDRIKKVKDITFSDGIVAYKKKDDWNKFDYKDEWLDDWNKYQKEYLKSKKYRGINDVILNKEWSEMEDYISSKFDGYERVKKVHKIEYETSLLQEFDLDEIEKCKAAFNDRVCKEVMEYFRKNNGKEKRIRTEN